MSGQDTIALLCEWGRWSREDSGNLGSKSAWLGVMRLVQPSGLYSAADICDDDAMRVDRAVTHLKRYDECMHLMIELYFLNSLNLKEIESRMRLTRGQCEKLFARACGWLECELQVKDQVA